MVQQVGAQDERERAVARISGLPALRHTWTTRIASAAGCRPRTTIGEMFSHRRRRPREGIGCGASLLLEKYRAVLKGEEYPLEVCIGDRYTVLRWLVRAAQLKSSPRSSTIPQAVHLRSNLADVVENINALRIPMLPCELDAFQSQVAAGYENYAPVARFDVHGLVFYRYRAYCRVQSWPALECEAVDIPWLTTEAVERRLVIPDVRKLAFKLFMSASCALASSSGAPAWAP